MLAIAFYLLNFRGIICALIFNNKELEREKTNKIEKLQQLLSKEEQEISQRKIRKLKTAMEYFDEIIVSEMPSRYILENIIDKI